MRQLAQILLLIILQAALSFVPQLRADETTGDFFTGLRQRSLFVVAEDYAVNQLSNRNLLPRDRAEITSELARTMVDHGTVSSLSEREELWNEAKRILEDYLDVFPNGPFSLRVESERALLSFWIGETLAWESQLTPGETVLRRTALESLTESQAAITIALKKLEQANRTPSPQELADGAMDRNELALLELRLNFFQTKAHFLRAKLASDVAEQTVLLNETEQRIKSLLRTKIDSELVIEAKLIRAKIARLLGDYPQGEARLRALLDPSAQFGLQDAVIAEQARMEIARGRLDKAIELINTRIQNGQAISDELRAVAVESLLAAWKIAKAQGDSALRDDLLSEAEYHHANTQGKWHQLTYTLLERILQTEELGEDLAQLVRDAQINFRQGNLQAAASQFQQAATIASESGKSDRAVEFEFTHGSIQTQLKEWASAGETFAKIVDQHPDHSRATDAGLMECYVLGQSYLANPSQDSREKYENALSEFQTSFAETDSAAEAAWMLAIHLEQRLQWTDAIREYRKIPATDPRFDTASLRIILLYEKILNRLKTLNGDVSSWEDQLLEEISRINEQFPQDRLFESIDQARTALKIAQLLLQHRNRWYDVADIWLKRIDETISQQRESLDGDQLASPWNQIARGASQLRIVSLAGQQRLDEARTLMFRLGQTSPDAMLGILLGLTELTSQVEPMRQYELGRLQLEAVRRLSESRSELSAQKQALLDGAHAEAMVATGNSLEAAKIYESLIKKSPRDVRLIENVIDVLSKTGRKEDLERARAWWTRYERLHKAGSPEWISARLSIAELDRQLGRPEEAKKLLGVTRALYPELGTPELKAEVTALLKELADK